MPVYNTIKNTESLCHKYGVNESVEDINRYKYRKTISKIEYREYRIY
jgi:hypothetical protein